MANTKKQATKDTTKKAPAQEKKAPRLTIASLAAQFAAMQEQFVAMTQVVTALAQAQNAPAPVQENAPVKKSSKKSAPKQEKKVERPTRDEWLAFKALHADAVAALPTKHERNSALWKLFVAEQTGEVPAPAKKTTGKKSTSKKSDTKKSTSKKVSRPDKATWLAFKASHEAEVASLPTQKAKNKALWEMFVKAA